MKAYSQFRLVNINRYNTTGSRNDMKYTLRTRAELRFIGINIPTKKKIILSNNGSLYIASERALKSIIHVCTTAFLVN